MRSTGAREYEQFLEQKRHFGDECGFTPVWMPDFLYDFQKDMVEWSLRIGRCAIFADCGLGKTPMQLVWAENVRRKTGRPVIVATPLAVGYQTVAEGQKFGIECHRSHGGATPGVTVTNYEQLHKFDPREFSGMVCDESSILKNFDGKRKAEVTEFMREMPYRLLCTATAAPNDYVELGTSSEALGVMGHMDMLTRFFRNVDNTGQTSAHQFRLHKDRLDAFVGKKSYWRFKHHAEHDFWRWVCSWARALRRPSDLGYSDDGFALPPLEERETVVSASRHLPGYLFAVPASNLQEEREERRSTIAERCEEVARKVDHGNPAVVWCHLNQEGDLLEKLIPDAVQVCGSMSDEAKEGALIAFSRGEIRVLVTKPKIGAFGMNWQHCNHVTFFPSHSYEQYYQGVRRCWRFGQTRPVTVDIVTTLGEERVKENLKRKSEAADRMFTELVGHMNDELRIRRANPFVQKETVPTWLS